MEKTKKRKFKKVSQRVCKHPPHRLYSWFAYDGTLCVACCDCGKVLRG